MHFGTQDLEEMGRVFAVTLADALRPAAPADVVSLMQGLSLGDEPEGDM